MPTSKSFSASQKGLAPIFIVILVAALALGGYFVYTNLPDGRQGYSNSRTETTPPPTTQSNPSPTPSDITHESTTSAASPVQNGTRETANWKIYTNTKYGYSIKYPDDYVNCFEDNFALYLGTTKKDVVCNSGYYSPIITIIQKSGSEAYNYENDCIKIKKENTSLAGLSVIKYTYGNKQLTSWCQADMGINKIVDYEISHKNFILVIQLSNKDDDPIQNQILSTFKFLP